MDKYAIYNEYVSHEYAQRQAVYDEIRMVGKVAGDISKHQGD